MACPLGTDDYFMGGAFAYQAPELFVGEPADQQSDIYSLGITAYELVTGRRPYREDDLRELLEMRETQEIPDPAEFTQDIPVLLRKFILKSCRRNVEDRYKSISEAMEDLRSLVKPLGMNQKAKGDLKEIQTSLELRYESDQNGVVENLLKEFRQKAKEAGVDMNVLDQGAP